VWSQQIPGGAKGVVGFAFLVPTVALVLVQYFGFISCVFYFVPVGVVLGILYTERELRDHENKAE
jgi:hypothetical protein